jgi:hypothetical protein
MKTDVHVISSNSKGFLFPPQGIVTQLHRGGKIIFFLRTWPQNFLQKITISIGKIKGIQNKS